MVNQSAKHSIRIDAQDRLLLVDYSPALVSEQKGESMEYAQIISRVNELDFIHDEVTADAAVKAVMGILFSRMDEFQAHRLAEYLPEPLTYQRLRGHQRRPVGISPGYYKAELCTQFSLSEIQAKRLIHIVYHTVKESIPQEIEELWESGLPDEWAELVREA